MLYFLFFFFLIFLFPLPVSSLIITEVQIEGDKADECYVKIYNSSEKKINVSGYNLRKKTSTGRDSSVRVFPEGNFVDSKDYFIWASSRDKSFPEKIEADISSTQYLSYNNSIALFNAEGSLLDALAWGDGENPYTKTNPLENPEKGQIIKREKENGSYSRKNDNSSDFYFYPPPSSPLKIESFNTYKKEEKKTNHFLFSLILSITLASLVLLLKRNI